MLDTNNVSYILKAKSPTARARLASLGKGEIACISAATEAEILYGIAQSGSGDQRKKSLGWFLARLKVQPWAREEAAAYASSEPSRRLWEKFSVLSTVFAFAAEKLLQKGC